MAGPNGPGLVTRCSCCSMTSSVEQMQCVTTRYELSGVRNVSRSTGECIYLLKYDGLTFSLLDLARRRVYLWHVAMVTPPGFHAQGSNEMSPNHSSNFDETQALTPTSWSPYLTSMKPKHKDIVSYSPSTGPSRVIRKRLICVWWYQLYPPLPYALGGGVYIWRWICMRRSI